MFGQKHGFKGLNAVWQDAKFRCMFQTQASFTSYTKDHYKTLGVGRTATSKEIKAAFYELSKKYHPDRHQDEKAKVAAAEKFQQVVNAYEILGSVEKRRDYDTTLLSYQPDFCTVNRNMRSQYSRSSFEDLDIDYKSFEQFQRSIRKRRAHRSYYQMPDEFYAEFGGREFTSFYPGRGGTVKSKVTSNNASGTCNAKGRTGSREKYLWQELNKKQRDSPLPSFDELQENFFRKKRLEEFKTSMTACFVMIVVSFFAYLVEKR